jgi:hypothetical protein
MGSSGGKSNGLRGTESSESKTKISRQDAKAQRFETKKDFKQEATEATEISVASLSSCLKFPRLGNARQNEQNVVAGGPLCQIFVLSLGADHDLDAPV